MIDLKDEIIQERITKIFGEYDQDKFRILHELISRNAVWPNLESEKGKSLLFIGINPSYDGKPVIPRGYEIQEVVKVRKGHYGQFNKMAQDVELGDKWTCLDLFYYREGNQTVINKLIEDKAGKGLDFICDQLRLTQEIIECLEPKIIIVSNASIRRFFGIDAKEKDGKINEVWMGYVFDPIDTEKGIYKIIGIHSNSVSKDTLSKTRLKDTLVIFSRSFLYMPRTKRENLKEQLMKYRNELKF